MYSNVPNLSYINLYLAWQCNFKCIHCWVEGSGEKKVTVDLNKVFKFIKERKEEGLRCVKITGGEPLIYKNSLIEIIKFCNSLGIRNDIETNGYLIDNELISVFKDYKVNLGISLNGYNSETNDKFTLKSGSFEKAVENIKKCIENKINISVITCVGKYNQSYLEKNIEFIATLNVNSIKINPISACGRATELQSKNLIFDELELLDFYNKFKKLRDKFKDLHIITMIPQSLENLSKIADGSVYTCAGKHLLSYLPNDKIALCGYGGINEDIILCEYNDDITLNDIWHNNPKLLNMRKYFDELSGVCGSCIHGKQCNSLCKVIGLIDYGRWDSPYPFCQKIYEKGKFPKSRLYKEVKNF